MIVEFAPSLLCLAALLAAFITALPCFPLADRGAIAQRLSMAIFSLVSVALAILFHAYIQSDFSVANVYENSHSAKPLLYKITGAWGNHEGSMLLWLWILTAFSFSFSLKYKERSGFYTGSLAVMACMSLGFLLFILLTSNPFKRLDPVPFEGKDLNPLLQDIGLAIHPPMLYLGYVGFSLVFALTVGALLSRTDIDSYWARTVRPWALLAWSFLTAGIGLGSWWAYRELGWGGWWFWDPVENISLLPWLSGTALIHCLLILCKRPVLKNWTLLLAILTCGLSLMGTFLVRSGLLTSVHSFASDPLRGIYVLSFTGLLIGGALWLYALRYPKPTAPDFIPISREGGILVNNVLLLTACATLFLGILYPILLQVFNLPSVSVGAPYYNQIILPLALPLVMLAGFGPMLGWKQSSLPILRRLAMRGLGIAIVLALALGFLQAGQWVAIGRHLLAMGGIMAGLWLVAGTLAYARREWQNRQGRLPLSYLGMMLAHGGLGIFVLATTFASAGRFEQEVLLRIGEPVQIAGYEIRLAHPRSDVVDNYQRLAVDLQFIGLQGQEGFTLRPESRFYTVRGTETAESAIHSQFRGDVYAAIARPPSTVNQDVLAVILRFYIIPAALWLWVGFIFTSLGGMLAAIGYFAAARQIKECA